MRNLILISTFACVFLHFYTKKGEVVQQHDELNTQQSAIKKMVPVRAAAAPTPAPASTTTENEIIDQIAATEDQVAMISDDDLVQEYSDEDMTQLPWDDIEEGWKAHLKEYLVSLDPEKAEDMFNAYMEEKKKYVERVDFSDTENGATESMASADDQLIESDVKEGDLERMHVENLKGIFGDHYSQIEGLHREYVESVQYLNRSSVKFTISL